ncbi:MAG: hypothetical protein OXG78_09440 [Chloroflexi bacterium]|nr:hypothetical protein [Chloroflexota bacterium]
MTAVELMERTHALLQTGERIYAARQTGLFQVDADGKGTNLYRSWPLGENLPTLAVAVDRSAGLMLAGINGGVARSTDGGRNWDAVAFRAPPPLVTCLAPTRDFNDAGWILAGSFEDGVFRSTDGGKTWRANNHGLFDHSVNCLAPSPECAADGIVYAGTSSGIYRSENGGKLWRDLRMPAGDETVLSLATPPEGAGIYAGTESHGLLLSTDGGESWARLIETGGAVNAIAVAADETLIAQVDDAALRSSDGGGSWVEIAAGGVDCLLLDEDGGQLILALSDGGLRREAL